MENQSILKAILRADFKSFLHKAFQTINPSSFFSNAWYLELLTDRLQYMVLGSKGGRLVINMPPRCLKSVTVSVALPAWLLGINPSKRIIVACYSQALSIKHSLDCRAIMASDWYKELFPKTQISAKCNTKAKFTTTEFGFRMSTSVGGSVTGEGADLLIIDDPHNPTFIHSEKMRSKSCIWFDQTFATRLNDQSQGSIIVTMQRLHRQDLTAHLLKKSTWDLLKIPAVCESEQTFCSQNNKFTILPNQSIDPFRLPLDVLQQIKAEISDSNFKAQYLQEPQSHTQGILRPSEISSYDTLPFIERIYQSWDTAIKVHASSDYSACTTWGVCGNKYYLIDYLAAKLEYSSLKNQIQLMADKWKPATILIEDKASGQSLIQDLRNSLPGIVPRRPQSDKVTRFASIIHFFTLGQALLPSEKLWAREIISELTNFPYSDHDDIVDSISQFFCYIQFSSSRCSPKIREII